MKSIEVSARTIEEAISAGLAKLECSIADCKVEIIQEGAKGLFGVFGSKPATVRLTPLAADDLMMDMLNIDLKRSFDAGSADGGKAKKPAPQQKPEKKAAKQKEQAPEKASEKPKKQDVVERFISAPLPQNEAGEAAARPKAKPVPRQSARKQPREASAARAAEPKVIERTPIKAPDNIIVHAEDTLAGIAQRFLLDMTERMGVSVQVDVSQGEDGHLFVTMYGDTLGILIGRRGETLDALQYLTSLRINKGQEQYTRITLDTENYRAKREEALVRLAARTANRAVKTGRRVSLEPMNPYERRIMHASLQNNENVTTHSEGDEPYRHVVVVPQK